MNFRAASRRSPALFLCLAVCALADAQVQTHAQGPADSLSTKAAEPVDLTAAELLKSYLQLREQFHAAQLTLVNNHLETEAKARAQAAAMTEKITAINTAIEAERESHRSEIRRLVGDYELKRAEQERAGQISFWLGASLGGVGLVSLLLWSRARWKTPSRQDVPAPAIVPPPAPEPSPHDRLSALVEKLDRRLTALERLSPPPTTSFSTMSDASTDARPQPRATAATDRTAWIGLLLEKGQSLLATNRHSEAIACFDEILRLDDRHALALIKKGAALEGLKHDAAALRRYEQRSTTMAR